MKHLILLLAVSSKWTNYLRLPTILREFVLLRYLRRQGGGGGVGNGCTEEKERGMYYEVVDTLRFAPGGESSMCRLLSF